ncbi:TPA: MAP7 domain-containing protein [Providencia rettgeri]
MYSTGTVTTTANSTKLVGTGTKWLNNINRVSAEQAIQIQIDNTVYNNSIQSIQSDTELTLNFPLPTAATGAKYVILTTMVHSASDAMNKIAFMNGANVQFSDILTRWMTEQGIITVTLPDQTTQQLRTTKEMDKQLDGKFDKTGGSVTGSVTSGGTLQSNNGRVITHVEGGCGIQFDATGDIAKIRSRQKGGAWFDHIIPEVTGTLMQVGDCGVGISLYQSPENLDSVTLGCGFYAMPGGAGNPWGSNGSAHILNIRHGGHGFQIGRTTGNTNLSFRLLQNGVFSVPSVLYSTANTTKDSNGNLKAASPVVKLFADDIELNDESEGVEMEHLGIGHYLIKGVVGFNADGAWGINNGFVIPQDHNGKNMVLIDYEVRPDGDVEVFVFHQQNADMPERFQNKRIKHFDEEGVPVYFENYEPCDVPESRWIDMRVEMPPNSLYNQKQAEAERLAKLEAERLEQEEAKRAAEEVERTEQEAAERKQYGLDENSVLL